MYLGGRETDLSRDLLPLNSLSIKGYAGTKKVIFRVIQTVVLLVSLTGLYLLCGAVGTNFRA